MKRVCLEPGCPILTDKSRCPEHRRVRERARGSRQARGYDAEYDAVHRDYQRRMDAGERFQCWRCPELGRPAHTVDPRPGRWHLGHAVDDHSVIRGPQCPSSNLNTASQRPTTQPGHAR